MVRSAHLSQYGLDPLPEFRLFRIAGVSIGRSLLSGFCDGFGALRFKKVTCESRNIRCIHFESFPRWSGRQIGAGISRPPLASRRFEAPLVLRHQVNGTKKNIQRWRDAALQPQRQPAGSDLQVGSEHLHTADLLRGALQSPDRYCRHSGAPMG